MRAGRDLERKDILFQLRCKELEGDAQTNGGRTERVPFEWRNRFAWDLVLETDQFEGEDIRHREVERELEKGIFLSWLRER